jgi:hypothetical protein
LTTVRVRETCGSARSKAAAVIQQIVETRTMPADEERLGVLFNLIAFQYVRTPTARRIIAAPREQAARIIIDLLGTRASFTKAGCGDSAGT